MSKNGKGQITIPQLLSRKRRIDGIKEEEEEVPRSRDASSSSHVFSNKRRNMGPNRSDTECETIVLGSSPDRPDTPGSQENTTPIDRLADVTFSQFRELSCCSRPSPLPPLLWAERELLWSSLLKQDQASATQRGEAMFARNPQVQPRMRSILLDWLIEVSDVYKLHRETYYLAQDYVDRVLLVRKDTPKQDLQLLGITCLFLAAKVEEIYPPKVTEFAYVTDGACTESAILEHEMSVLSALEWELCPLTPAGWLRFYLQLACQMSSAGRGGTDFELPRFPSLALPLVSKLLDLATLDAGCVKFRYSVLSAAALALVYGRHLATITSKLDWQELRPCIAWMAPFAVALSSGSSIEEGEKARGESPLELLDEEIRHRPELLPTAAVSFEDSHNLQNHAVSMELLEIAQTLLNEDHVSDEEVIIVAETKHKTPSSKPLKPRQEETPEGLLTPPASTSRGKTSDMCSKNSTTGGLRPTELFIPLTPST